MSRRQACTAVALVGFLVLASSGRAQAQAGRAETSEGPVQGVLDVASGVWEFRGVPYAAPPTGPRRFARPAPPAARAALLVADEFAPACPQVAGSLPDACSAGAAPGTVFGDEHCLALNVFTPAATWPPPATLPVMVYVHGGAFEAGCERASTPALAADGQVVLIRIQYRVGLLGFLGTEEMAAADPDGSAGNWGLLDVIRALEWVRDNAAAFGGDPDDVTVFGESAGGVAVCSLLASPLADGLFRRAIIQSGHCQIARPLRTPPGSALDGWSQAQIGGRIAAELGCDGDGAERLACLRALPARDVVGLQPRLTSLGLASLQATVDGHLLDERPLSVLEERGAGRRAVVVGSNANEYSAIAVLDPAVGELVRSDYPAAVRAGLGFIGSVFRPLPLEELADEVLALYPDPFDPEARIREYGELFGDLYGNCPALEASDALAAAGSPTYLYHFSETVPSPLPQIAALGAFHSLDVFFVFGDLESLRALTFEPGAEEERLSAQMIAAWSGFAARAVPATTPAWPRWQRGRGRFFEWSSRAADPIGRTYRGGRCTALHALLRSIDADRDLVADVDDNCPTVANVSQLDADHDGVGDRCEACSAPLTLRRTGSAGAASRTVRPPCARTVRRTEGR